MLQDKQSFQEKKKKKEVYKLKHSKTMRHAVLKINVGWRYKSVI